MQNFVSAATGMAVLVALVRGFVRKEAKGIGNFWVDLTRTTVYILLPLSLVLALVLVWQGVPQTFDKYATATLTQPVTYDNPKTGPDGQPLKDEKGNPVTEKATATEQTIPLGPVASQIAIKQLGTNGGGYLQRQLGASAGEPDAAFQLPRGAGDPAHPGGALLHLRPDGRRHAPGLGPPRGDDDHLRRVARLRPMRSSSTATQCSTKLGADQVAERDQHPGGNMEGKEVRFGIANSALWATATTAASNGSVNSMHDSFTPLGGLIPMWLMQLGEVIFGGVGSGLYGMIMFAVVAVFIAGLDDRAHAGVSGQEDRRVRDQDGVDRDPVAAAARALRHRGRGHARRRQGRCVESRRARLLGDPLRLLVG